MRLKKEFFRLCLHFDAQRLAEEATAFEEQDWRPHPSGYEGNTAIVLIGANGEENDSHSGVMLPTEKLKRSPYIQQVLTSFKAVIGRSRLMRLAPGANVNPHCDTHYYWRNRVRIHIPIVTDPAVKFHCNGQTVHMAPGEAWIFDNWRMHSVENPTAITRIHLVADTVGSVDFWQLARRSEQARIISFDPERQVEVPTERYTDPAIMSPGDLECVLRDLLEDLDRGREEERQAIREFTQLVSNFASEWRSHWVVHGPNESGWQNYQLLIQQVRAKLKPRFDREPLLPSNGVLAADVLRVLLKSIFKPWLQAGSEKLPPAFSPEQGEQEPVPTNPH